MGLAVYFWHILHYEICCVIIIRGVVEIPFVFLGILLDFIASLKHNNNMMVTVSAHNIYLQQLK